MVVISQLTGFFVFQSNEAFVGCLSEKHNILPSSKPYGGWAAGIYLYCMSNHTVLKARKYCFKHKIGIDSLMRLLECML